MRRFALCLVLIAGTAHADREAAGIHFQAAQAAEKRGDWKTAITEYEQAYKLAPHPSVLFNMGQAYEKLDENRRAAELFERYLRGTPKAEDRDAVTRRIEGLRDRPSKLRVDEPSGATLIVDGEPRGTVPLTIEIAAGTHTVVAEVRGDRSVVQQLTASFGEPLAPQISIIPSKPPAPPPERAALAFGFGIGVHPGLGGEWNAGAPLSFSARLRGSYTITRKLRGFVELGGMLGPQIEDDRVGIDLGPKERFVLFTPRGGAALTVYQHPVFRVDTFAAATLVAGYHSLSFGTEEVAKQGVLGAGLGGGIEIFVASEKTPRSQWYVSAGFHVVPATVGTDTGFRSNGAADLGGLEFAFGWAVKLGVPAPATSTWSASR